MRSLKPETPAVPFTFVNIDTATAKAENPTITGTIEFTRSGSTGLVIDQMAVSFGTVDVGASSAALSFTQLEARSYCAVTVVFNAATSGEKAVTLTVSDSAATATVTLTGSATPQI